MIISNCVINLSGNKAAVYAGEASRVLRPGGRLASHSASSPEDHLTATGPMRRGSHVGCIAGALSFTRSGTA